MEQSGLNGILMGVSSSAYQIEGAWKEDGKGESIWDRWTHIPGTCEASGDVAADHYHLWEEDLKLLKELNVQAYRFSISWPRIFPEGFGDVNPKGIEFYKNILKRLKDYGIRAVVTLNHWDLPQKLQDIGGWCNPDTAEYFNRYAAYLFSELGGDVDYWITHNEPWVAAFMGYQSGKFAPGHRDLSEALLAAHNMLLAHGRAVKTFRESGIGGKIGISLDYFPAVPASGEKEDLLAAQRDRESHLKWFADPVLKGGYPQAMWEWYEEKGVVLPFFGEKEMELIHTPIDFLGINFYRGSIVKAAPGKNWPYDTAYVSNTSEKTNPFYEHAPENLYRYLKYLDEEYGHPEIMITENGFSNTETVNRFGQVTDYDRIDYLYRHIEQAVRARQEGVRLSGYFVWSFLDDLEWTGGFKTRMGLVRVDYRTQKRTVKKSGYWYRKIIEEQKLCSFEEERI